MSQQVVESPSAAKRGVSVWKLLLAVLAMVFVALVALVASQPAEFFVERSATLDVPPAAAFDQVNDFHNWQAWSPWAKKDPNAKIGYDGPASGTGAVFRWSGNDEVGEGQMTLIASQPNDLIRIRLEIAKPLVCENAVEFHFTPAGDQTTVRWSMTGRNGFVGKMFSLCCNMDKMVGGEFEQGLAEMKRVAEAAARK